MSQSHRRRPGSASELQLGGDDDEWLGYNSDNEPGIKAFVLSIFGWLLPGIGLVPTLVALHLSGKALDLAEDGLATNGGLAYAARIISLMWLLVLALAVLLLLLYALVSHA
jgi:hypothetical protein